MPERLCVFAQVIITLFRNVHNIDVTLGTTLCVRVETPTLRREFVPEWAIIGDERPDTC